MASTDEPLDLDSFISELNADTSEPTSPTEQPSVNADPLSEFVPDSPEAPTEEERSTLTDMALAPLHGIQSAVREAAKTGLSLTRHIPGLQDISDSATAKIEELEATSSPFAPQTTLGKLEADLTKFGIGFALGGTYVKGAGLVATAAKSAIGTGIVADPHEVRLSNLLQEHPYLENPVSDYLQAKPGDSVAEGKFKAALEDVATSGIATLAYKTFKAAKSFLNKSGAASENPLAIPMKDVEVDPSTLKSASTIETEKAVETVTPKFQFTPEDVTKMESAFSRVSLKKAAGEALDVTKHEGGINVTKMNSPEEVRAAVNELMPIVKERMKSSGWTEHQTIEETKQLASELGAVDPELLFAKLSGMSQNAQDIPATLLASRMVVQKLAADVFKTSNHLDPTVRAELPSQLLKLAEVQAQFKDLQTGVGRGLSVLRAQTPEMYMAKLTEAISKKVDPEQLADIVRMTEGKPEALARVLKGLTDSVGTKVMNTHNEFLINAMLSGPKTHIVNVASTALNTLMQPAALTIGGVIRRDWADVREGLAVYHGLRTHLADAWGLARKAFVSDRGILNDSTTNEVKAPAISAAYWQTDGLLGAFMDGIGKVTRLPGRFLTAEDEFFKQLSYRAKVSAQAAREAADLMKAGKLEESQLHNFITERFAGSMDDAGRATQAGAMEYANKVTFTQDLNIETRFGNIGQGIANLSSSSPLIRGFVLPFVKVPTNLMRNAWEFTPVLGQLRKQFQDDMTAGGTRASEAIGRAALGFGMYTTAGLLAMEGKLTGAAPRDPELSAQLKASGWQPYSFVFTNDDGTKEYLSYSRLDPFGMVFGIVADFMQTAHHVPASKKDEWAAMAVLSASNNLASKSYMKGASEFMSMLMSPDWKAFKRYAQSRLAAYVPSALGVAQADTGTKELRDWTDGVLAKVPGFSGTLEPKRDLFGVKILPSMSYPAIAVNPFTWSKDNEDPVKKELARLALSQARAEFRNPLETIGNVDLTKIKDNKGRTAYDHFLEKIGTVQLGGRNFHDKLRDVIDSARYQNGTDGDSWYSAGSRVNMIRATHDSYKDAAMKELQKQFPVLKEALRTDKTNRKRVGYGKDASAMEKVLQFGAH